MASEGKPVSWFITFPVLLFGFGALGGGCYLAWTTFVGISAGLQTTGIVAELVESSSPKLPPGAKRPNLQGKNPGNKPSYAPIVEYQVEGKSYRIRGSVSSNPPAYTPGERVTIRYVRDNPAEGKIDSFSENWMAPLILSIFGAIFSLVGFGLVASRRRHATVTEDSAFDPTDIDR